MHAVMIGTTHFTNAVVEREAAAPTAAVIRLGAAGDGGAAADGRLARRPARRRSAVTCYSCHGGYEFDGRRDLAAVDRTRSGAPRPTSREGASRRSRSRRSSRRSTPRPSRRRGRDRREELPGVRDLALHEIGRIGLLERENATIMNACLRRARVADRGRLPRRARRAAGSTRAVLPQPERRHADGGRLRGALPGARPSRPGRRTACAAPPSSPALNDARRRRHRRHDLRRRRAPARLSARGVGRGRDRRRAHELPHARRALVRARRRQPRASTAPSRSGRRASATS